MIILGISREDKLWLITALLLVTAMMPLVSGLFVAN